MLKTLRPLLLACVLGLAPLVAVAQGANVAFGGLKVDSSLPVEIESDQLDVDQASGVAVFSGNVLVGQGELRLAAATVRVEYDAEGKAISKLHASGGVTLANATEAAEASDAVYTIATGSVVMTGNVLLTQGESAISGQRLVIDVNAGTGTMEGRVQTVFVPAKKP